MILSEIILRNITNKIRSSLDIEAIKYEIVNQVGKFFNADGVRMAQYNNELEDYIVTDSAEYRSSDNVKSCVGISFKNIPGFNEEIKNTHLS